MISAVADSAITLNQLLFTVMSTTGYISAIVSAMLVVVAPARSQGPSPDEAPAFTDRPEIKITSLETNSDHDDFAPVPLKGALLLYYTSTASTAFSGSGQQNIWTAERGNTGWSGIRPAGDSLGFGDQVGSATLTPDGNFMIFAAYRWDNDVDANLPIGRTDLYSAERVNGEWTNVRNLGPGVNSEHWDSQPWLSSDGRTLYFSSDRPGGRGGTDIYISHRTASGWSAPANVGLPVNSALDELTPSLSPDNRLLFFSSNGHGGVGGHDLFVVKGGDEAWSGLENLGTPINSAANEHYYASIPNSKNALFSSDRSGNLDNYIAFPNPFPPEALVTVSGKVIDARSRGPVAASITVTDLSSGEVVSTFRTDGANGEYYVILTRGRRYSITAEAPDYIFYSDEYSVPPTAGGADLKKDIELFRTSGGTTRLLVYFDFDRADLKNESKPDLNRGIRFLQENPTIRVEIAGHTDSLGTDAYNNRLSQQRAESVRSYLIQGGIDAARVIARGYGEAQPIADNGTDDGRARNRRVEMRVR